MKSPTSADKFALVIHDLRRRSMKILWAYARITNNLSLPPSLFEFVQSSLDFTSRPLNSRSLMHFKQAAAHFPHFESCHRSLCLELAGAANRESFDPAGKREDIASYGVRILERVISELKETERLCKQSHA